MNNSNRLNTILEELDILFDEMISVDISEEGRDQDLDFDHQKYLESFSYPEKIKFVIERQSSIQAVEDTIKKHKELSGNSN